MKQFANLLLLLFFFLTFIYFLLGRLAGILRQETKSFTGMTPNIFKNNFVWSVFENVWFQKKKKNLSPCKTASK